MKNAIICLMYTMEHPTRPSHPSLLTPLQPSVRARTRHRTLCDLLCLLFRLLRSLSDLDESILLDEIRNMLQSAQPRTKPYLVKSSFEIFQLVDRHARLYPFKHLPIRPETHRGLTIPRHNQA
jgi:hypothetical protein